MRLSAELVVLSACRTALGKEVRGEGLVGLTSGFMDAGARRVVGSLWSVPDAPTAALMSRFYTLLVDEGRSPADALRGAQLALRRQRRFSAPQAWAGFVLEGDWRPLPPSFRAAGSRGRSERSIPLSAQPRRNSPTRADQRHHREDAPERALRQTVGDGDTERHRRHAAHRESEPRIQSTFPARP